MCGYLRSSFYVEAFLAFLPILPLQGWEENRGSVLLMDHPRMMSALRVLNRSMGGSKCPKKYSDIIYGWSLKRQNMERRSIVFLGGILERRASRGSSSFISYAPRSC